MVQEMLNDFKFVTIYVGDPITGIRDSFSHNATNTLKYHGIVRGVEGYMFLNVADDVELEETCVELSECTW